MFFKLDQIIGNQSRLSDDFHSHFQNPSGGIEKKKQEQYQISILLNVLEEKDTVIDRQCEIIAVKDKNIHKLQVRIGRIKPAVSKLIEYGVGPRFSYFAFFFWCFFAVLFSFFYRVFVLFCFLEPLAADATQRQIREHHKRTQAYIEKRSLNESEMDTLTKLLFSEDAEFKKNFESEIEKKFLENANRSILEEERSDENAVSTAILGALDVITKSLHVKLRNRNVLEREILNLGMLLYVFFYCL